MKTHALVIPLLIILMIQPVSGLEFGVKEGDSMFFDRTQLTKRIDFKGNTSEILSELEFEQDGNISVTIDRIGNQHVIAKYSYQDGIFHEEDKNASFTTYAGYFDSSVYILILGLDGNACPFLNFDFLLYPVSDIKNDCIRANVMAGLRNSKNDFGIDVSASIDSKDFVFKEAISSVKVSLSFLYQAYNPDISTNVLSMLDDIFVNIKTSVYGAFNENYMIGYFRTITMTVVGSIDKIITLPWSREYPHPIDTLYNSTEAILIDPTTGWFDEVFTKNQYWSVFRDEFDVITARFRTFEDHILREGKSSLVFDLSKLKPEPITIVVSSNETVTVSQQSLSYQMQTIVFSLAFVTVFIALSKKRK